MFRFRICVGSLFLAGLCPSVAAQPLPPLVTDRPDFTESAVVVPLGSVQAEAGVTSLDSRTLSGPELLVRWTPIPRLELRFGAPDYTSTSGNSGFSNPSLGAKVQFGPFGSWDLGVIGTVSTFADGSVDPEVIVAGSYARSERAAFGGQVVVGRDGIADVWTFGGTLVYGIGFPDDAPLFFDERWGVFIELAATVPERGAAEVLQHTGFTYALSPNVQLDVHTGAGLTNAAPSSLLGAGVSVRR